MRKFLLLSLSALLVACGNDVSGPGGYDDLFAFSEGEFGSVAFGMPGVHPGRGLPELGRLKQLPDSIKLSAQQEAEINGLLEAFQTAHRADLEALATIMEQAKQARAAGKSREEVAGILAQARPIHLRMAAAHIKLAADINALLTPAQKAWLTLRHMPCNPGTVTPLTDAQKTQIRTLHEAFQTTNKADLDAVKAALEQARAARQAGATREQVQAILDGAKPAMERLQAAGDKLRADIDAVLTPEQKASGCFMRGGMMPRGPMGGMGGR